MSPKCCTVQLSEIGGSAYAQKQILRVAECADQNRKTLIDASRFADIVNGTLGAIVAR